MKTMIRMMLACACLMTCLGMTAQEVTTETWAKNLLVFGKSVPQEEVYVHMDNTSYYVGDTIFYKVYSRLSTGAPSKLSGLIYVELLNDDGYLVERENIRLTDGHGHGCFVLTDSLYAGFYELRAYTRWQLNWGVTEHPHADYSENWFYHKRMMHEYYRDYDKLYSRVFPVYNHPKEPGQYNRVMIPRPLRRYFKTKYERPQADLTFYPEGGSLVAGARCRVAFEANDKDGAHLKGTLTVRNKSGEVVAEARTQTHGRGKFEIDVQADEKYTATFSWGENSTDKEKLPQAESDGCAVQVRCVGDTAHLYVQRRGAEAENAHLAYTLMSHGVLKQYKSLEGGCDLTADIDLTKVPDGVAQLTIYGKDGRIWADRLFFVRHADFRNETLTLTGWKDGNYKPFEKIEMGLEGTPGGIVSVAVRDEASSEYTFDSGTMLTEMLLASQIKGFVEQPEYYFEADDEEHREALDLLLMIQGWRRYRWDVMATPGLFNVREPYEPQTQWIYGEVNKLPSDYDDRLDLFVEPSRLLVEADENNPDYQDLVRMWPACEKYFSEAFVKEMGGLAAAKAAANLLYYKYGKPDDVLDLYIPKLKSELASRYALELDNARQPMGTMKHEVTVHAEFTLDHKVKEGESAVLGDMLTYDKGQFRLQTPQLDGYCYFFCTASDQEKWKNGKHPKWIVQGEEKYDGDGMGGTINYPEFYVRFRDPYPRWVKPYNFYQAHANESPRRQSGRLVRADNATIMREVTIGAQRGGLKGLDLTKPALVLDALTAYNATVDAGLCAGYYPGGVAFAANVEKAFVGDMNQEKNIFAGDNPLFKVRFNGRLPTAFISPYEMARYNHMHFIESVAIYTDYAPRREGDKRFTAYDQPEVTVNLIKREDNTMFVTNRDRRKVMWGYSVCEDYYHRDYSGMAMPDAKDYRRTLYWNPDVKLDEQGRATITLWNNSRSTNLSVSAQGMGANGEPLSVER